MQSPVNASQAADVAGFNYVIATSTNILYPTKLIYSPEDTSAVKTREGYLTDRKKFILDSYDDQVLLWGAFAPGCGSRLQNGLSFPERWCGLASTTAANRSCSRGQQQGFLSESWIYVVSPKRPTTSIRQVDSESSDRAPHPAL